MDIARTPSNPAGNPEMADAAVEPVDPATIFRKNYTPPAWLVPEIRLDFDLGIELTKCVATLKVERNPDGDGDQTLHLCGDNLAVMSLKVDGADAEGWSMSGSNLLLPLPGASHEVTIETHLHPATNSQLMGLYASSGMLCTQCEAEGFRRITFFPDRPDVLSKYTVRMEGDKETFPVLLSNGNLVETGEGDAGRQWALWDDPWPKPSYLFALVAGQLVANRDTFTTMNGRKVELAVWVREGDLERTDHAMRSLINSMKWDEETFGREYDLDQFNIVAVSDFNMGAMENKGLNIFNTRYVLADPETATDGDYDGVEGVVGHEYFHNWSGNRITCRDWFQLSLKEGFTVLRDQMFSADMGSEPVKRIEDVRVLRAAQFPEDSGPLAHPIRPDSYQEISNFYTATVYNKGAEVIRMMHTMAGPEAFRKGTDLYFDRHDGEAATCEDFVKSMEDGAGLDLSQFRLWYEQAGTPKVTMRAEFDQSEGAVTLHFTQKVPATPGQPVKKAMPIPVKVALFDRDTKAHDGEKLLIVDKDKAEFTFKGFTRPPVISANRGFTAPIQLDAENADEDLVFLAANDDDAFARYEALQQLVTRELLGAIENGPDEKRRTAIADAMGAVLDDTQIDDLMRGELMMMPAVTFLLELAAPADPVALHNARERLKSYIGSRLRDRLIALHERASAIGYSLSAEARGARKVKTQALVLLSAADAKEAAARAEAQYRAADNMTDRQGALMVLAGIDCPARAELLEDFRARFEGNALVTDKWFALQAGSLDPKVLDTVEALANHADFTIKNPNRVRSLYMTMAVNQPAFHDESGRGYRMIADLVLKLDPLNAQTAARFIPALGRWRKIEPKRAAMMRAELERIAKAEGLSKDTREQVTKSLDG
ncbi:aminopeptidase N [Croceicoccus gelatinilyticus]|uniref:aminopeptidase N n=1 Tax=Croceicoccus gelatinilyticus TaxID=2835536 RepID=UPI001BCE15D4|nr:aminopeptidase N [Croceicoccus gelatinilyticus]MBS7670164.1 aminopeptidase N [Croceicoccus gelatinilyticus]